MLNELQPPLILLFVRKMRWRDDADAETQQRRTMEVQQQQYASVRPEDLQRQIVNETRAQGTRTTTT